VHGAAVTDAAGNEHRLPLVSAPFGTSSGAGAPPRAAQGPDRVERQVASSSIGWLERREPRGEPVSNRPRFLDTMIFGRIIRPDPNSFLRVLVALLDRPSPGERPMICFGVLRGRETGVACPGLAERRPWAFGPTLQQFGGDQYGLISGIATDDVASIDLYLATGERLAVPFKDNVFVTQAPRVKFPARLVAYAADGAVVGLTTFEAETGPRAVPGKERVALEAKGRDATAVLRVAPSTDGGRCWRLSYSTGSEGGACPPKSYEQPVLDATLQPAGRDVFVEVQVNSKVVTVVIEPHGLASVRVRPVDGFVIHALQTDAKDLFVTVRALAADGRELAKRGLRVAR
jgi:hypothetical protein